MAHRIQLTTAQFPPLGRGAPGLGVRSRRGVKPLQRACAANALQPRHTPNLPALFHHTGGPAYRASRTCSAASAQALLPVCQGLEQGRDERRNDTHDGAAHHARQELRLSRTAAITLARPRTEQAMRAVPGAAAPFSPIVHSVPPSTDRDAMRPSGVASPHVRSDSGERAQPEDDAFPGDTGTLEFPDRIRTGEGSDGEPT
jgi:hypothetical protein